eukprot:977472-Pelagomonas_calceolata.AAC.8
MARQQLRPGGRTHVCLALLATGREVKNARITSARGSNGVFCDFAALECAAGAAAAAAAAAPYGSQSESDYQTHCLVTRSNLPPLYTRLVHSEGPQTCDRNPLSCYQNLNKNDNQFSHPNNGGRGGLYWMGGCIQESKAPGQVANNRKLHNFTWLPSPLKASTLELSVRESADCWAFL